MRVHDQVVPPLEEEPVVGCTVLGGTVTDGVGGRLREEVIAPDQSKRLLESKAKVAEEHGEDKRRGGGRVSAGCEGGVGVGAELCEVESAHL